MTQTIKNFIENLKENSVERQNRRFMRRYRNVEDLLEHATESEKVRWFELASCEQRFEFLKSNRLTLDSPVKNLLWAGHWPTIAPFMYKLSATQFKTLLTDGMGHPLQGYLKNHTMSENNMVQMIEYIEEMYQKDMKEKKELSSRTSWLKDLLVMCVKRDGMGLDAMKRINACSDGWAGDVCEALVVRYHVTTVKNGTTEFGVTPAFETYLNWLAAEKIVMPDEAQKLLTISQYKSMIQRQLHLSENVIVECIAKGDQKCACILDYEPIYPASNSVMMALLSNPTMFATYQRIALRREQKA